MTFLLLILVALLPTCPTDGPESTFCYWDATQAGNGLGSSFIALSEGITIYLD